MENNILLITGQILAGLIILIPFLIKDRIKEGKWFLSKTSILNPQEITVNNRVFLFISLILGFSSISFFFLNEIIVGYGLLLINIIYLAAISNKLIK